MQDSLVLQDIVVETTTGRAVDGVSLDVPPGEIVALLGPNGAGKSELVLGVAGVLPVSGSVRLGNCDLTNRGSAAIRRAGIAAIPEGHQTLPGLTVLDNLRAAGSWLAIADLDEQVEAALAVFPELRSLCGRNAASLSGGQQQMAAIAQALVGRPRVLLLDEMSLGLAPIVIERLVGTIRALRDSGLGILLIEQFTELALDLADRCHVIAQGRLRFSGVPRELRKDRAILEQAYLG